MTDNNSKREAKDEDFGFFDHEETNAELYHFLSFFEGVRLEEAARMTPVNGYSLWRHEVEDSNFVIMMRCEATKRIIYFIKCYVWDDVRLGNKPLAELQMWRSRDIAYLNATRDLTSKVFFNYLLTKHSLIASGSFETVFGRYFWETKMTEALALGHGVYRYSKEKREAIEITDPMQILDSTCGLWSENALALIGDI